MPGGDMITWLCNKGVFDYESARFYIAELCMAVASVHAMNFVHRDIKPDNILFGIDGHIKLSDFGLSKRFENVTDTMQDDEASGDSVLGERGSKSSCANDKSNRSDNAIMQQEQSANNSSVNGTNNAGRNNNDDVVNVTTPLEVDMANSLAFSTNNTCSSVQTTTTTTVTSMVTKAGANVMAKMEDNEIANNSAELTAGLTETMTTKATTNSVIPSSSPSSSPSSTTLKSSASSRIAKMLLFNSIVGSTGYVAP